MYGDLKIKGITPYTRNGTNNYHTIMKKLADDPPSLEHTKENDEIHIWIISQHPYAPPPQPLKSSAIRYGRLHYGPIDRTEQIEMKEYEREQIRKCWE